MVDERTFPIQGERRCESGRYGEPNRYVTLPRLRIPWSVAEIAYRYYSHKYGTDQSLERLAERGGFGRDELAEFLAGAATLPEPATPPADAPAAVAEGVADGK